MPFQQTAGYYGLQLSPEAEAEITSFNFQELATLNHEVAFRLITFRVNICTLFTTQKTEDEINKLSTSDCIALLRWLSDRLAFLHTVPVHEVAK
jgi:hypothetical protein